jgi:hydroxymethylglutaryl-CoA lyase
MFNLPNQVEVVEVGPRDGFQNIKEFIPTQTKLLIIDALISAGVTKIEVTSFVHPKAIPQMSDASQVVEALNEKYKNRQLDTFALVPNLFGAKNAYKSGIHEVSYVISASERHNMANINRTCEQSLQELQAIKSELPELNIRLDVATAFGCPFIGAVDESLVLKLIEKGLSLGVNTIVLCDTIGVADPKKVSELSGAVLSEFPNAKVGIHLHDTRGMGLANTLAALDAGILMFETSVGGLGGCPFAPGAAGNTATEDMINMLHKMGIGTGIDLERYLMAVDLVRQKLPGHVTSHMGNVCR